MWCEGYDRGWPIGRPICVDVPDGVGMFMAVDLDPEYFTGLPFKPDDAGLIAHPPMQVFGDNFDFWTPPTDITIRWHEDDDLLSRGEGVEGVVRRICRSAARQNST